MNFYIKRDPLVILTDTFLHTLENSLREIGEGVARDFINMERTPEGMKFIYKNRTVEFDHRNDPDEFWLKMTRGTKGAITSPFQDDAAELVVAINVTLNWLIHQEFSTDDHIELTARLAKEARKYE